MTELEDPRVIDVLLVEDDEGDVLMTREAFEYYKIQNRLHVVGDGEQALQFLRRTGPYADAPRPGLILLDVNLPRRSGMEVLKELKQDDELLMIPVIMLTTSQAEETSCAATRCTPTRSSASPSTSSTSSTPSGRSTPFS
jgi:CheY-like chemotaxis protein